MDKIDTREKSTEIQQHNRDQAIRLHSKGLKRADIPRIVGVHPSTLGAWISLYNKGGAEALKIGARGRRTGEGRRLSEPQENKLKEIILGKFPDQMKLPFALWSSTAIRSLIAQSWLKSSLKRIKRFIQRSHIIIIHIIFKPSYNA